MTESYVSESLLINNNNTRKTVTAFFDSCTKGLGIKIIGGCSVHEDEDYGIFIKRIIPGGLAEKEGSLRAGDQILTVNEESLEGVTKDRAVALLRKASASDYVTMVVARDNIARIEFIEVLEKHIKNGPHTDSSDISSSNITPDSTHTSVLTDSMTTKDQNEQTTGCMENVSTPEGPPPYGGTQYLPPYQPSSESFMASTPFSNSGPTSKTHKPDVQSYSSTKAATNKDANSLSHDSQGVTSEDNNLSYTLGSLDSHDDIPSPRQINTSLEGSMSFPFNRLILSLKSVEIIPTQDQENEIQSKLQPDTVGCIQFSDFSRVVEDVMGNDEQHMTRIKEALKRLPTLLRTLTEASTKDKVTTLAEAQTEILHLRTLLKARELSCSAMEEEVLRIRKEAQAAIHETRSLRSKVHLAEQAQKAARDMEHDYEDVVRLMEDEITDLRLKSNPQGGAEWQKRVSVLTCQLKKTESAKKIYEVSTEKLLQFVEKVYDALKNQENGIPLSNSGSINNIGEPSRGGKPPGYLANHKTLTTKTLASEARDVVRSVKTLTDTQPLPYGWEEAYSKDGVKYFIDHLTQTTSWSHPISNVQQFPLPTNNKPEKSFDSDISQ